MSSFVFVVALLAPPRLLRLLLLAVFSSPNISFPAPIYPFVGREVLVQSLAHGIPLGQFLNDQALDRDHFDTDADPAHKSVAERITKSYLLKHEEALREAERTGSSAVPPPPPREPVSPLHSEIARLGLQMYLHMLMENNFVHSDLHPGNILVQMPDLGDQNGTTAENVRDLAHAYDESSSEFLKSQHVNLVILDSGLVSTLTPVNRRNFLSLFGALILVREEEIERENARVCMLTRIRSLCRVLPVF